MESGRFQVGDTITVELYGNAVEPTYSLAFSGAANLFAHGSGAYIYNIASRVSSLSPNSWVRNGNTIRVVRLEIFQNSGAWIQVSRSSGSDIRGPAISSGDLPARAVMKRGNEVFYDTGLTWAKSEESGEFLYNAFPSSLGASGATTGFTFELYYID